MYNNQSPQSHKKILIKGYEPQLYDFFIVCIDGFGLKTFFFIDPSFKHSRFQSMSSCDFCYVVIITIIVVSFFTYMMYGVE